MTADKLYKECSSLPPNYDTTEDTTKDLTTAPTPEDYAQKHILVIFGNKGLHGMNGKIHIHVWDHFHAEVEKMRWSTFRDI